MWIRPKNIPVPIGDTTNQKLLKLEGELSDEQAMATMGEFFRHNLGLTCELLSGVRLAGYQEINILALFLCNYSMNVWGRGCSKTVSYNDTYVIEKNKGLILLKDLYPNFDFSKDDLIDSPFPVELWNGKTYEKVNKVFIQPKKRCYKITTKRGYNIIGGAANHLIKTINKDKCEIEWKKFDVIKVGDYACISRKTPSWGSELNKEEKDESYLVGLFLGDGHISDIVNWRITTADQETINFCKIGITDNYGHKKGSKAIDIRYKKEFTKYLQTKYGIKTSLSYTKEIPQFILSNKERLKNCLSALFDTDGCVRSDGAKVEFCSVSEKMAKQVHDSLLIFGIVSSIKERKTKSNFGKCYKVTISGNDLIPFYNEIGFRLTRKQAKLKNYVNSGKIGNSNTDIIPGFKNKSQEIIKNGKISNKKAKLKYNLDQKEYTYLTFDRYLNSFENNDFPNNELIKLKEIKDENFYFDEIIKIEEVYEDCLDFNIPIGESYWGNGFINHNSFIASIFCFLYCIFNPGSKIIIAGPTFRTARFIFGKIEEILKSPEAQLLQQCFGATSKRNDVFEWEINKGKIIAIPLNGEKIRGFRCNVLVLDEANWLEQDMIEKVLMPFLVAPKDIGERLKQKEKEEDLIAAGKMTEEERTQYDSDAKMILLSSAGYTFEYLYKLYQEWLNIIENAESSDEYKAKARYFVCQLAYNAVPEEMMDQTIIKEAARNGGDANSAFKMEYGAQFCDGSDSYFNAKKMEECTLGLGEYPHTLIKGNPDKKYIISIDPNSSDSPSSDYFAIAIMELDDESQTGTLVHGYQGLGGLTNHVKYLAYLLANFNIVFGIGDAAGLDSFLDAANNSEEMMTYHKQLKYLDFDTTKDGQEYLEEMARAKQQYNQESGQIIIRQYFTGEFIRRANEYLQSCINYKKVFFASKTAPNSGIVQSQIDAADKLPKHLIFNGNKSKWSTFDFIDHQDDIIYQTKRQCSHVEFSATTKGSINFDLPQHMRRMQTADKPRKDNYSALVMANWAIKHYYALLTQVEKPKQKMYVPSILK